MFRFTRSIQATLYTVYSAPQDPPARAPVLAPTTSTNTTASTLSLPMSIQRAGGSYPAERDDAHTAREREWSFTANVVMTPANAKCNTSREEMANAMARTVAETIKSGTEARSARSPNPRSNSISIPLLHNLAICLDGDPDEYVRPMPLQRSPDKHTLRCFP